MSMSTVRTIITKSSADPEFKSLIESNPEHALSSFDLTVEECDAVARTARRRLSNTPINADQWL